ncbi:MAG TPA: HEPN domain-containing protein [Geminicoccaceae bacterium]|nr:HEPN domain-containing protein [Geminicoccaceae bacterium]
MSAEIARRWLRHVRRDLDTAWSAVRGPRAHSENAAYFIQQAGEKLIKAALVLLGKQPPRLHDLAALAEHVPDEFELKPDLLTLSRFSSFAVEFRYPDYPSIDPPPTFEEIDHWVVELEALLQRLTALVERKEDPSDHG